MEWTDEGIVLSVRAHGETSAIVEVFTSAHGRHLGLVRGGRSRQMRPILQIGNHVHVKWSGRLAEHLGSFRCELLGGYAALAMENPGRLAAVSTLCTHMRRLPERDAHASLFEITLFVLSYLDAEDVWPGLMVRWELAFLEEMGFGLDLSECAASGRNDNLIYVSPKSGRAVSAAEGEPYADRLIALPQFLVNSNGIHVQMRDIMAGFALTGYFLERSLYRPGEDTMPDSRERMVNWISNG
ncbi:MAG: DNA repair protein RecO [Filomicrobium sp.]